MAKSERINLKTGKIQYKSRYYWKDENGKTHDAQTGWFDSKRDADREARALKQKRELECGNIKESQRNVTIKTTLELFKDYCQELFQRSTTENTTTYHTRYSRVQSIINKYTPEDLMHKKVRELNPYDFRKWMIYINEQPISGAYIHGLRDALLNYNEWLANKGYYSEVNFDMQVRQAIMQAKTKKIEPTRKEHTPTIADLNMIQNYYVMEGLDNY